MLLCVVYDKRSGTHFFLFTGREKKVSKRSDYHTNTSPVRAGEDIVFAAMLHLTALLLSTAERGDCERFCSEIATIWRTPGVQMSEVRSHALSACFHELFATDPEWLDPSSRVWLHDLACDALKILLDYGSFIGYVIIDANATTSRDEAWRLLLERCGGRPRCKKKSVQQSLQRSTPRRPQPRDDQKRPRTPRTPRTPDDHEADDNPRTPRTHALRTRRNGDVS